MDATKVSPSKDLNLNKPFLRRPGVRNRLIAYAGLAIVITVFFRWFGQYVLYPAPSRPVVPSPPPEPLIEVSIQGASGRISAWLMEPAGADETTPLMVFFHGNGENLQLLYQTGFFHQVVGMGTGILAVDYPGYGNSEGQPDEEALQDCGKATLTWARQQYPNRPLIIAGWSLGAAVAIRNAADSGIDYQGLVLISPWSSLGDVARHHFPNWMVRAFLVETYDSMEAAPRISTPTLAIHGTEDEIIPEPLGRRLAQAIPDCHYEPVPLFGHNDIISAPMFWSALKTYFQEVVP